MSEIKVDLEQLKYLLFAGVSCTEVNEMKLLKIARDRLIEKATVDGVFYPVDYKRLWERVWVVTKRSSAYEDFRNEYEHFNPFADYPYEFLGESAGEYAVLFNKD